MIQLIYVGARQGGFQLAAMPSRRRYSIPAPGAFVEQAETGRRGVYPEDVEWFRTVNQGRDFRIVDQPATPKPVTQQPAPRAAQPAPQPAPRPVTEKSAAWDMGIMEMEPLPEEEPEAEQEVIDVLATDAARELAEEHGLDLAEIEGSGYDGKILVSDVRAALD